MEADPFKFVIDVQFIYVSNVGRLGYAPVEDSSVETHRASIPCLPHRCFYFLYFVITFSHPCLAFFSPINQHLLTCAMWSFPFFLVPPCLSADIHFLNTTTWDRFGGGSVWHFHLGTIVQPGWIWVNGPYITIQSDIITSLGFQYSKPIRRTTVW